MFCFGVFWFFLDMHFFYLQIFCKNHQELIIYQSIKLLFFLSVSRFYFLVNWPPAEEALLDWCWKQRFCLISEWLMENCQGKGACCLHISPWKASPKKGYPVDWIFSGYVWIFNYCHGIASLETNYFAWHHTAQSNCISYSYTEIIPYCVFPPRTCSEQTGSLS